MAQGKLTNFLHFLATYKFFLPPDVFERHQFIGSLIPPASEVLDVGGSLSRLKDFSPAGKVTTVDIKGPADIIYDGKKIPVGNKSYDVVTSIDVLEHVPKDDREAFIKELRRVAKVKGIISAPLGTREHSDAEKTLLAFYAHRGVKMPFLKEHIEIGLPTPAEITVLTKGLKYEIRYSGDIRLTAFFLKVHNFEAKSKILNLLIFFGKLLFNLFINTFLCPFLVGKNYSTLTNRFYLLIESD